MSHECGLGYFTLASTPCSGGGNCVFNNVTQRGECICFPNYEGKSDFHVTSDLVDCQINLIAIRFLWALNLLAQVVFHGQMVRPLRLLWNKHQAMVEKAKSNGTKYALSSNKGLFAVLPYVFITWASTAALAILKIVNPSLHIGIDWAPTVLWWLGRSPFYYCGDTYQPNILASLLKSERTLTGLIRANFIAARIHMFLAIAVQFSVIPVLVMDYNAYYPLAAWVSIAMYFNIFSLCMFFLAFNSKTLEIKVTKILDASFSLNGDKKTLRIKERLSQGNSSLFKLSLAQGIVFLMFGILAFMWRFHDYLLPTSWILMFYGAKQYISHIAHDDKEDSSEANNSTTSSATKNNQVVGTGSADSGTNGS